MKKYWLFKGDNWVGVLGIAVIIIIIGLIVASFKYDKEHCTLWGCDYENFNYSEDKISEDNIKGTYTYTNHGFSIELPEGFVPKQEQQHSGPGLVISLPVGTLVYVTDSNIDFWQTNIKEYVYVQDKKIGETTFKIYTYLGSTYYWYQKGKVAYEFSISTDKKNELETILGTFKFVGWPQVEGNKDDLVSFSIKPGSEINGNATELEYTGFIKGGYFFEANIVVNILSADKKLLRSGYAAANGDWMTIEPVSFQGFLNLSGLPKGKAYIEIHNDNASGLPENDKSVLIPIIIK